MILSCDANAMAQDIRIVCNSTDTSNNGCSHMMNGGAEGKLVRLPNNVRDISSYYISFALKKDWMAVWEDAFRNDFQDMGACKPVYSCLDAAKDCPSRWRCPNCPRYIRFKSRSSFKNSKLGT